MKVFYGKKSFDVDVHKVGFFRKGTGLMFRGKNTENLLFDFRRDTRASITSFFCFFDFLALWLDEKNRVVEWAVVKPFKFTLSPSMKFRRLIEVPINEGNKKIIDLFVEGGKV